MENLNNNINNLGPAWEFLRGITLWGVVKWFIVTGMVLYMVFAAVMVKQAGVMTESVESEANSLVKLLVRVHLLATVVLTVAALVVL
ncbi:hypothetical protein A3H89_02065 [Candidatus Amesbacteria bacterium RIFCSPLOWO2_02_FULL_48_11]|nr:MAG: hypothetical protein A3H89_02065 [Candidatus Amesbacteria bacterium RIFCSPLOWO2_02_FULL_48_11]